MTAREIVQKIARLEGYGNDEKAERIIQQALDEKTEALRKELEGFRNGTRRTFLEYQSLLEPFFQEMLERLKANSHKSGWDDLDPDYAISRLKQETRELEHALFKAEEESMSFNNVIREAADVANFAAMIAYGARDWLKEGYTTTFEKLREHGACQDRYRHLAKALGGIRKYGKTRPIPLTKILETNGIEDAIWALRTVPKSADGQVVLFGCACIRRTPVPDGRTVWDLLGSRCRTAVETAEKFARGEASRSDLAEASAGAVWESRAAWAAASAASAAREAASAAREAARTVQAEIFREFFGEENSE